MRFIAKRKDEIAKVTDAASDYVVGMAELEKAIKYHEEMAKERYLNDGSHKQYAEWLKELKAFREKRPDKEWTSTGDELPELEKYVLCQCRAGIVEILRLTEYGWLDDEECHYMQGFVIAWMPLPEPYKEANR